MSETSVLSESAIAQMSELVTTLAKAMVDEPSQVRVEPQTTGTETVLRLHVAPDDLGKLIGKQGRTARSLRTILAAAGLKLQHRFSLDVQSEPQTAE